MDFEFSARSLELQEQLRDFVTTQVVPAEPIYAEQVAASGDPHFHPPVMEELKAEARRRGLWNLFLPDTSTAPGLTNLEYAPLCELMGRNLLHGGGDELRRARHRQHGDPRPVRHAAAAGAVAATRCSTARSGRASR